MASVSLVLPLTLCNRLTRAYVQPMQQVWTWTTPEQLKSTRPHSVHSPNRDPDTDDDMLTLSLQDEVHKSTRDEQPEEDTDNEAREFTYKSNLPLHASDALKVTIRTSFLAFHCHYAITAHLGQGSYSTVKQVKHRTTGKVYACKIVDKRRLSDLDRAALAHEVQVLSRVHHVNIMRLYEVIQDDATCYLITEYAHGGDLFDRIVQKGKFSLLDAQLVTAALVDALAYCHTHCIVHRDVKPENVLLSDTNEVKLCDFGFARQLKSVNDHATESCGTPGYAAPEILNGQSYNFSVDVFSLGVVTYILLCGYPPFPMTLAQLRTHRFHVRFLSKDWDAIPPSVKTLLAKMLHVDPRVRPTMASLRTHPWIQTGTELLAQRRQEEHARRQEASVALVRTQLGRKGLRAVKYGRTGHAHRTKLWFSHDGHVLNWQPQLWKRSFLHAQSLTRFFRRDTDERTDKRSLRRTTTPRGVPTRRSRFLAVTAPVKPSPSCARSIPLREIRTIVCGHEARAPCPTSIDPACFVSIATSRRQLQLTFPDQSVRDGFVSCLEQATLHLHQAPTSCPTTSTFCPTTSTSCPTTSTSCPTTSTSCPTTSTSCPTTSTSCPTTSYP